MRPSYMFFFVVFWVIHVLQSQKSPQTKYIDSLIHQITVTPDTERKVAIYGRLYEKLMHRDQELSFTYAKKEYALSKKLEYNKGMASGQLHFADYYKNKGILDSARYYFEQSAKGFRTINSLKGELFVNHSVADLEKRLGNYHKALEYAQRNISLYQQRDTTQSDIEKKFNLIGSEYELIGGIHQELGNYRIALKETIKAKHFFEQKKDTIRTADAFLQLGAIEYLLGNYPSSISNRERAFAIYKQFKDHVYMIYALNGVGECYLELKKPNAAKPYFEKALAKAETIENIDEVAMSLVNLGIVYRQLGQFQKARQYIKKGLEIHEKLDYQKNIAMDLNQLAQLEFELGNYSLGIPILDRSITIAYKIGAKDILKEAYKYRSMAYEKIENPVNALIDYKNFKAVNDTIFTIAKSQQIQEMRTLHETQKKEQQITLQRSEIALLEQQATVHKLQRFLLGLGLGLLLLIFGLAIYSLRQKMKREQLEKDKITLELDFKKKELITHALHLAKKNEVLEGLKQEASVLKTSDGNQKGYRQLIQRIDFDLRDEDNWKNFSKYFEEVHKNFNKEVKQKFPNLTANELRLMALLKMNLSSKEIANILNISAEGIKKARYRLRKKVGIATEESLEDLVIQM